MKGVLPTATPSISTVAPGGLLAITSVSARMLEGAASKAATARRTVSRRERGIGGHQKAGVYHKLSLQETKVMQRREANQSGFCEKPGQARTGRRGYFGKAGSVLLRSQRRKKE